MPATQIPLTPVESSLIASYGYDPEKQVLAVAFKRSSGDIAYEYDGVTADVFGELEAADSKGSFINQRIVKGGYSYRRMDPAVPAPTEA